MANNAVTPQTLAVTKYLYDDACQQVHREHYLVRGTLLRIEEDEVITLHQRTDGDVTDDDLAAEYRLNQTVGQAAGEEEQRGADENKTPGLRPVQHDSAIVCVPHVSPVLLHVPHAFANAILLQHQHAVHGGYHAVEAEPAEHLDPTLERVQDQKHV